jgi:hypothetical protein
MWFEGTVVDRTGIHLGVNVDDNYEYKDFTEVLEISSERLMFHGAHTNYEFRPHVVLSNAEWRAEKGIDVYQYRIKNGPTLLVDHLLSEKEEKLIIEENKTYFMKKEELCKSLS